MQPDGARDPVLRQRDGTRPRLGGNPPDFHLTGGGAGDGIRFETLLDIGPDIRPRIAVADKGYDSQANRTAMRAQP